LRSTVLSRKLVTLASAGVLCLAFTGAAALSWAAAPASFAALTRFPPPLPPPAPALTPRQLAGQMLARYGWGAGQFACLDPLWPRESGWNPYAQNPRSGAYGIPQALPGDKMAAAGADWQTNAATQIKWGLTYIQGRYGSPCGAWFHQQATGWY
jgi:resuscitation-promoting factor RpfB